VVRDVELGRDSRAVDRMVTTVPRAGVAVPAGEVRAALRDVALAEVAALDGERFVGLVPLERLLLADAKTTLGSLVDGAQATVAPDADQEAVAWEAAHRRARAVAVVDGEGRLLGVVPPERLIAILEHEHEEDLARLGGFLAGTSVARTAAEEPVGRRLWHRLPWLALGLAGAMLSAGIVAGFEDQLRRQVLLAFFVPAVVYMADAVGTQTEAVVIRGMAIGVPLRRILVRELTTGLVIGVLLASAFFAFAVGVWGESRVAAAVAIALLVSASIATLIAMSLPYALARLGRDPAFGSGPLATVIQDLLSILVYFAVAAALV
jgi:magnesium transporter